MKTVHCGMCESRPVCFMQKQIEGLAERMTQPPFLEKRNIDIEAHSAAEMAFRHKKRMNKRSDLENELKRIIALHCTLFS